MEEAIEVYVDFLSVAYADGVGVVVPAVDEPSVFGNPLTRSWQQQKALSRFMHARKKWQR